MLSLLSLCHLPPHRGQALVGRFESNFFLLSLPAFASSPLALVSEGPSGAQQSGLLAIRQESKGNQEPWPQPGARSGFPEKPWSVLSFISFLINLIPTSTP